MAQQDMFKSGDYAAVLAYRTEYVVEMDFLHVSEKTLDLVVGDEVEVMFKDDETWWFGRLMGTDEMGIFPSYCVSKKWPVPITGHGCQFTTFAALPQNIRDRIYADYFGLQPDAAIRVARPAEREAILQQPSGSLTYLDSAKIPRTTWLLNKADIFATCRFVAADVVHWLTENYTLRVITYDTTTTTTNRLYQANDANDDDYYPPRTATFTLPLVQFTRKVSKLQVDIKYLVGAPKILAKQCDLSNITSLRVTFRAYSAVTNEMDFFSTFKYVLQELKELENLSVREEMELVWIGMEELFAKETALDKEMYCRKYLEGVDALKKKISKNWMKSYEPQRLLEPLGVPQENFKW